MFIHIHTEVQDVVYKSDFNVGVLHQDNSSFHRCEPLGFEHTGIFHRMVFQGRLELIIHISNYHWQLKFIKYCILIALSQNEHDNYYLIQQDPIENKYLIVTIQSKYHINKENHTDNG